MLLRPPSFRVFTETWLKKQALSCGEEVVVTVPFQFLHLWTSERFQPLIESPPKALKPRDANLGPPGGTKVSPGSYGDLMTMNANNKKRCSGRSKENKA
ncbi:hypothetical protein COP2_007776 [Malus domestica]